MQIEVEQVNVRPDSILCARDSRHSIVRHPYHLHAEAEIACVVGAQGVVYCGAAAIPFESGQVFLIGENVPHQFVAETPHTPAERVIVLQFDPRAFGDTFWRINELDAVRDLLERAQQGIAFLESDPALLGRLRTTAAASGSERITSFLSLLGHLAGRTDAVSIAFQPLRIADRSDDVGRFRRLQHWLQTRFAEHHAQDEVASELGMSRTSLCRWVRSVTGRTYSEILNDYRIGHARMLLRQTDMPIDAIAAECGYENPSTLYREFRKRSGSTPGRFRNEQAIGGRAQRSP
jgi:AraC-like DNA-binding protein